LISGKKANIWNVGKKCRFLECWREKNVDFWNVGKKMQIFGENWLEKKADIFDLFGKTPPDAGTKNWPEKIKADIVALYR